MRLNLSETAEFFGAELNTVKQWVRKGLPVVEKGRKGVAWSLDSVQVSNWLREREREEMAGYLEKTDIEEARRRKLAAEAAMAELALAKDRGEVVPIDDVIEKLANELGACKARLLGLPTKLAAMAPADIRNELRERFDNGIREALAEIVEYTPPEDKGDKAA